MSVLDLRSRLRGPYLVCDVMLLQPFLRLLHLDGSGAVVWRHRPVYGVDTGIDINWIAGRQDVPMGSSVRRTNLDYYLGTAIEWHGIRNVDLDEGSR